MIKHLIFSSLIVLFLISTQTFGQSNRISINSDYHIPGGDLKWIYDNAFGFQANYSRLFESNRGKSISAYGLSIGYSKLKPTEDTLYYLVRVSDEEIGFGTAVYSDYTILQAALSIKWEKELFSSTYIQYGFDFGFYFISFEYDVYDDFSSTSGSVLEGKGAIAPVIGLVFRLGENFSINPYFRYNFFISIGSNDPSQSGYNADVGSYNYFFTPGLSLHFNF